MNDSLDYTRWIQRCEQDKKILDIISETGIAGMEDTFCYICHQGIEKLLKALILKDENNLIKSHDLIFLLGKCVIFNPELRELIDDITILNEYPISARYPVDFEESRTLAEAKEAYILFNEIYNEINKYF